MYVDLNVSDRKLREFQLLAEAAGYVSVETIVQNREPDSRFYVGSGKLKELREVARRLNADTLITYHELKPRQHFNLEKELKLTVMDRVELILEIFDKRAGTREAKLQIELSRLKHKLPLVREYLRLAKMGEQIGFHGAGEYAIESYYRYLRQRIAKISGELREIRQRKKMLISKRKDRGVSEIVLTGYTMAGKTTLFNALTRDLKYRDGRPFATLNTYSHLVDLLGLKAVLTDTIGFIDDLPPLLIEAFYATIEEIAQADLIVLVLDASESISEFTRKLRTSIKILRDLSVPLARVLPVLNKIDLVDDEKELRRKEELVTEHGLGRPVKISAEKKLGLEQLKETMLSKLAPVTVEIKSSDVSLPAWLCKLVRVVHVDDTTIIQLPEKYLDSLLQWIKSTGVNVAKISNITSLGEIVTQHVLKEQGCKADTESTFWSA